MRGRHVQSGELCRSASRAMRYVRARSGSELSSGATGSVRNDDVSGVSQAAARAKYEAATMPDTCMEGIQTCDSATGFSLSVPSAGTPFFKVRHFVWDHDLGPSITRLIHRLV